MPAAGPGQAADGSSAEPHGAGCGEQESRGLPGRKETSVTGKVYSFPVRLEMTLIKRTDLDEIFIFANLIVSLDFLCFLHSSKHSTISSLLLDQDMKTLEKILLVLIIFFFK